MRTHRTKNGERAEFYKDHRGEWRWRIMARNGRCIADSSEGYKRLKDATHGLKTAAAIGSTLDWHNVEVTNEAA